MAKIDDTLWASVMAHEDTVLEPPGSGEALVAFEASHGFRLPESHREFLLRGNGGSVGYVRLFGVSRRDALDFGHQVSEMRSYIAGMADGPVLPFASDWGGSYFCYDLRRGPSGGEYPVLYWNHEYSEEPDDRPLLWSTFAPDFLSFVKKVIA